MADGLRCDHVGGCWNGHVGERQSRRQRGVGWVACLARLGWVGRHRTPDVGDGGPASAFAEPAKVVGAALNARRSANIAGASRDDVAECGPKPAAAGFRQAARGERNA